jgi:hypothetical protein
MDFSQTMKNEYGHALNLIKITRSLFLAQRQVS